MLFDVVAVCGLLVWVCVWGVGWVWLVVDLIVVACWIVCFVCGWCAVRCSFGLGGWWFAVVGGLLYC